MGLSLVLIVLRCALWSMCMRSVLRGSVVLWWGGVGGHCRESEPAPAQRAVSSVRSRGNIRLRSRDRPSLCVYTYTLAVLANLSHGSKLTFESPPGDDGVSKGHGDPHPFADLWPLGYEVVCCPTCGSTRAACDSPVPTLAKATSSMQVRRHSTLGGGVCSSSGAFSTACPTSSDLAAMNGQSKQTPVGRGVLSPVVPPSAPSSNRYRPAETCIAGLQGATKLAPQRSPPPPRTSSKMDAPAALAQLATASATITFARTSRMMIKDSRLNLNMWFLENVAVTSSPWVSITLRS